MIPIRNTVPCKNYPVVNTLIIAVNILVYLFQLNLGPEQNRFLYSYGLVPARYTDPNLSILFSFPQQLTAPFTFMFLHGSFWHLIANMWSLYIFGGNIEDRLGPFRYLIFYTMCGIASGFSHFFLNFDSTVPVIGASGAIAGVMGAYFVLYPKAKILTLIPIFFIPYFINIPAYIFLGLWFAIQFFNAAGTSADSAGIAWWAHIGGFIFGIFILNLTFKIPSGKIDRVFNSFTKRKRTEKLQIIHPIGPGNDPDLYGTIFISAYEADMGTKKRIYIPVHLKKRLLTVTIPSGITQGTLLRLNGLGKVMPDNRTGNLILKVSFRGEENER